MNNLTYPEKIFLFASLGDGCICKRGYLNFHHSEDQKEYIFWKYDLFTKLGFSCTKPKSKLNKSCNKKAYYCHCKGKEFGKKLRKLLYTPKKDFYKDWVLDNMTDLGLAIWYMDDGCLRFIKDKNKNIRGNMIQIHTACKKDQAEYLAKYFKNNYNYLFKLFRDHKHWSIYMSTRYARKFLARVEKYIRRVPSMYYKVDRLKSLTFRSSTTIPDMGVGSSDPKQETT